MPALLLLLAVSLLALGVFRDVLPWIVDDAFISLRYADRLVAGEGLTWTDGERVEGYSNLLWVLATALLGWLCSEEVALDPPVTLQGSRGFFKGGADFQLALKLRG